MTLTLIVGLVLNAIALPLAGKRVLFLERLITSGQPAPDRVENVTKRTATALGSQLVEVLGQKKLLKWSVPGAAHAFVVSTGWLRAADGTHRYAFELPLFAPPPEAAAVMGADRRMYVVAWSPPATDVFFDSTSNVVYVMPDGTIVDPSCDAGGCGTGQMFAQAYDEIRGTLGG